MKISYTRSYAIGPFLQEKIGIEDEIDLDIFTDDGKIMIAFQRLKELTDMANQKINTGLQFSNEGIEHLGPLPVVQREKPIDAVAAVIADIETVKELKVLESYKFIAKTNEKVQEAYDKKLQSLQNQQ